MISALWDWMLLGVELFFAVTSWRKEEVDYCELKLGCIIVVVLLVVFVGIPCIGNKILVGGNLAEIEALRKDVVNVSPDKAEDVIGQVTVVNQAIASRKYFNQKWFLCLYVPNEWDSVEPIEIPRAEATQ